MKKTAAQSVSTYSKTANSTTINAAQRKCPQEKLPVGQATVGQATVGQATVAQATVGKPAGVGATGKRTKRVAASTMETLFNSSPLASRMRDDLVLAGCGDETQISYVREMKKMVAYFGPYLEEPALNTVGLSVRDMQLSKRTFTHVAVIFGIAKQHQTAVAAAAHRRSDGCGLGKFIEFC